MQEAEEENSRMLQDSHARLQECESNFAAAMREAEAQIAQSCLAEEHMSHQLQDAHMVIGSSSHHIAQNHGVAIVKCNATSVQDCAIGICLYESIHSFIFIQPDFPFVGSHNLCTRSSMPK